jgi:hypothetical protein
MLTAPWPEAVRETPKVLFVNLIEDRDHGLLNNLVLQRRDPQRTLPSVRFRYVDSPRRLRSISAAVNPAVQINKPIFQPGFILPPRNAIHSWSSFTL